MNTTQYKCAACGKQFRKSIRVTTKSGIYEGCPHCGCWDFDKKRTSTVTKHELRQYLHLLRETKVMEGRLQELERDKKQYTDLYEMYQNNKLRCLALTLKIESFIFDIDDSLMRQIMEARYIRGLSWVGVSSRLGGFMSADYLRITHDRFLKGLQNKEK